MICRLVVFLQWEFNCNWSSKLHLWLKDSLRRGHSTVTRGHLIPGKHDKISHLTTLPWERTFGPLLKPKAFIRSVISVKEKKKHVKIHNFNPQKMWKLSPYKYTMTVGGAMSDDHYTRVTAQGVQPILFSQIVGYPSSPSQKDSTSVIRRFPWCKPYSYVTQCPIARVKTNPLWSQTIKTF